MAKYLASVSAVALTLMLSHVSLAQTYRDSGGTVVQGIVPVGGNQSGPLFTPSNPGSVTGTFSASFSGFQPTPSYSYQSVTTTSATYALPTGTVAVFYNTGSTAITAKLGSSSVTVVAGQGDVIQPDSWMAFTVGSATYYAVVGNGGTSSVVASGGAGLPTGAGGSGNGTMTQGSPNTVANAWPFAPVVSGSAVSSTNPLPIQGVSGGTAVPVAGTFWQTTQPVSLASLPALSAGSSVIGAVTESGTWTTGRTWSLSSGSDSVLATISGTPTISGTVTANAGTNLNTSALAVESGGNLAAINGKLTTSASGLKVDGSAVTQPISGSVSISGTPSVSITGTPVLGVGSSTIGKADILGNSGASLDSAAGTTNSQALTIQGNASGIPVPVVGTFSATLGGFIPTPAYSVENVIPTSSTYALPTGAVIIFYNTGSTAITVKLGASGVSVTAGQADVIQPNSWMAFTVGTATYYAVIGNGGTSTVVASGGSGLPTGAGGGGGGGSVGAVGTPDITGYSNGGTATTDTGDSYGRYMEIKAGSNAAQLLGGNAHIVGATGATLDSAAGTANGQALTIQGNAGGVAVPMSLASLPALAAGSATIGKADVLGNSGATLDSAVGTTNAQALTTQGGGPTAVVAPVILPPQTTGGWGGTVVANLTTPVVVKASAGTVGEIHCEIMSSASNAYVQILNAASSPALGANVIGFVPLVAGTTGGKTYVLPGLAASAGISIGLATTANGSTAAGTAGNCEVDYE